jgi:hypothetical protein
LNVVEVCCVDKPYWKYAASLSSYKEQHIPLIMKMTQSCFSTTIHAQLLRTDHHLLLDALQMQLLLHFPSAPVAAAALQALLSA